MLNTLKEIEQSTATTLVQELLLSWGKIMWFVSYTELIRNTKPDLEMLKIRPVDCLEGCKDGFVCEPLSVYYYKGYFYCLSDKNTQMG